MFSPTGLGPSGCKVCVCSCLERHTEGGKEMLSWSWKVRGSPRVFRAADSTAAHWAVSPAWLPSCSPPLASLLRSLLSAQPWARWPRPAPSLPHCALCSGVPHRMHSPQTSLLHPGLFINEIKRPLTAKQPVSAPKRGQSGCPPPCAPFHQPLPAHPAFL